MMIVMKPTATAQDITAVEERVNGAGARAHVSPGDEITLIGAIGNREHIARLSLEGLPGVASVVPILKPYKLASSELRHGNPSVLEIDGRRVGGTGFALIAGPCTVESRELPGGVPHGDAEARLTAQAPRTPGRAEGSWKTTSTPLPSGSST